MTILLPPSTVARWPGVLLALLALAYPVVHGEPPDEAATRTTAGIDWPVYLGDTGGTHFSTLTQITPANVARLEPIWSFHTGDASANNRSQMQCNPLIIDGILYGSSPQLQLFAVDAATGRERWHYDPVDTADLEQGGGLGRGVAWWQEGKERRILYSAGHYLQALDPETGKRIESFGDHGRVDLLEGLDRDTRGLYLAANTPGAVFRDLIIIPARLAEGPGPAAPGHLRAYDVRTGQRRWIFHTIPFPGEKGGETWSPDSWKHTGGTNCWAGLVIDHPRGLAFVPTGSATFDFWGGDRQGNNLFANCLLAIDAATGQLKWHFQFVHHDVWDRDLPAPPVLCDIRREGKIIAAVAQVTKSGHVWVFNRETGESLFPWQEIPVPPSELSGETTSPTQPLPLKPAAFARQRFTEDEVTQRTPAAHDAVLAQLRAARPHQPFDPPSTRGTIVLPGFDGGAEWGGAAVDPQGILYVNNNEMAWLLTMVPALPPGTVEGPAATYQQLCMSCHGPKAEGNSAQAIPSLVTVGQRLKSPEIVRLLATGRGAMPSFGFLSDEKKAALANFLVEGNFEPPAVQPMPVDSVASGAPSSPYVTTGYNRLLDPEGYPGLRPPWGKLNALDLSTGEYLWQRPLGESPAPSGEGVVQTGTENYGGPIVTAGGIIFIAATKDEKFRAFDAKTGELLWETSLPAGGYATPATYSVGGRQFVVIACGGGKMGTKSGDSYEAFALPAPER